MSEFQTIKKTLFSVKPSSFYDGSMIFSSLNHQINHENLFVILRKIDEQKEK